MDHSMKCIKRFHVNALRRAKVLLLALDERQNIRSHSEACSTFYD